MGRFNRPHKTKSLIDHSVRYKPGECISVDTGDSNTYSVFRNSRYKMNFVDAASFYRIAVYLQDNSALRCS